MFLFISVVYLCVYVGQELLVTDELLNVHNSFLSLQFIVYLYDSQLKTFLVFENFPPEFLY